MVRKNDLFSFDSVVLGKETRVPKTSFMICLSGKCCRELHNPQQAVEQRFKFDLCIKALKQTTFTELVILE